MSRQRPGLKFSHLGIFATDVERQAGFYKSWLDFTETDRGHLDTPDGQIHVIFLSRDPDEHHQLIFVSGRPAEPGFNNINQISLKADSLPTLQGFHKRLQQEDAPITELIPITHGNALSVYFRDPEGNRVELYIDTPWYVDQPNRVIAPFDLPADELMLWAEQHARGLSGFRPRSVWRQEMARRMGLQA